MWATILPPFAMYPVALFLIAIRGWWIGNLESTFAAPMTALFFTLLDYPIAAIGLWSVSRLLSGQRATARAATALAVALVAFFAFVWPLGLFHLPIVFMLLVVGTTGLTWAALYVIVQAR
jgi:hypothetical protein